MRGLHRLRAPAKPEGVHAAAVRAAPLRRLLGLLLAVRVQRQRDGARRHPTGGQPGGGRRQEVPPRRAHGQERPQAVAARKAGNS